MKEGCSYRAFARLEGVTDKAVRKAVASGRIRSVGRDERDRPFISDVEQARVEFRKNAGQARREPSAGPRTSPQGGELVTPATLNEAQRLATMERVRKLRLENDLKQGRLVDVKDVTKEAFESSRVIREAMLNLPARLSSELAAEGDPARVYRILDNALREALVAAADAVAAVNE